MSALPMPEQGLLGMPSFDMSEDEKKQALNMGLLAAGAGILAGNRGNYGRAGPAIGQGLLAGMQTYQGMNQQARQEKRQRYGDQMQAEQFRMKQEELLRQRERQGKINAALNDPNATDIFGIPAAEARQLYAIGGPEALTKAAGARFEPYTLSPGGARYSGSTKIAEAAPEMKIAPSGQVYDPRNIQPGQVFNDPNQLMYVTPDGKPVLNQPLFNAKTQLAREGSSKSNTTIINDGQKGFDNELKLRGDFRGEPVYKAHQEMKSAYSQIKQALGQASPAGDLAGATKIMKLLDPGSVVRESELGMAMAASGLIDRVTNYADMIRTGKKLTPTQRIDFQNLADKLFQESVNQYNAKGNEYRGIAKDYGFNEERVTGPLDNFTLEAPAEKPPLSSFEKKPR